MVYGTHHAKYSGWGMQSDGIRTYKKQEIHMYTNELNDNETFLYYTYAHIIL